MLDTSGAIRIDSSQAAGASLGAAGLGCLHELFERQVDARGAAVAVICGDEALSYYELERRANWLAHRLREMRAGPSSLVGIALGRSMLPIVAVLGCLKAGAAYVPIDPSHPDDRIRYIVTEAEITALITEQEQVPRLSQLFAGPTVALDVMQMAGTRSSRLSRRETGLSTSDLCYVIYTSGTTGRPKGVMTEHRNTVHFVHAFNRVCRTTPADRIFQGFSLGFDGSVEEMWMAFSNGATLVVPTRDAPRFGNELARYLARQGVTCFSTVPTMLTTMTEAVPTLRQLVVSGEVCQPQLVERWALPGRLMLNVYGPTETTVNTTAAVCKPGQPVTIGRPLEGYEVLVLDGELQPLPRGAVGELCIGGGGVARGYLKQPDLTASSFIISPHNGRRLYRTGDLGCINAAGEIEYFGRLDSQVKIRGHRVELAEIEAVLLEQPRVIGSVANLHEAADGTRSLAAYVVVDPPSAPLDRGAILAALRARLPAYMIPAFLDVLLELPLLVSGKADRKRLPAPVSPLIDSDRAVTAPATALERTIAAVWASIFRVPQVGIEQNFFLDLGGHSLLAAQMAALLRSGNKLDVAVRDVYAFPTVRELARHLATSMPAGEASNRTALPAADEKRNIPSLSAALLQGVCVFGLAGLAILPLIVVVPLADPLLQGHRSLVASAFIASGLVIALWPVLLALSIAAKWLIIGRYRPGAYPLWGSYYLRWWLVARLQAFSGAGILAGTPLMGIYYRLMGAKVGRDCVLDTALCSSFDLVTIGDGTSIGAETQLLGYRVENGALLVGRVDIGSRCFIGLHSALGLNARMGDGARLDDQSMLPDGEVMAPGEQRRGSPAQSAKVAVPEGKPGRNDKARPALFTLAAIVLGYACVLFLAAPTLILGWLWVSAYQHGALAVALLISFVSIPLWVVFYCLWIALLKALVLARAQPGVYGLYSIYYLRHWIVYSLMRAVRSLLLPLFTTIYLPPFMRLLGARIGAHSEMSTIWCFTPDLLAAGQGSFFADGCFLGGRRCHGGLFELRPNRVGSRSFVGNSALLPPGAGLGDNCLLGVLSSPPATTETTPDGTDWLGSPAFRLPNRQKVAGFGESRTFKPAPGLYAQRALIDACRILVPIISLVLIVGLGGTALLLSYDAYGPGMMLAIAPFVSMGLAALAVAIVVTLKWGIMGKFKPVIVPLWCPYVWLNEMVNGAYETMMAPVISLCFGTPFAAWLLRLLGCRIGPNGFIATSLFSEFDLVEIGDHVSLNSGAVIQNHLFEDRIMKSSNLRIDDRCSIGNMTVVLYDTHMQRGAVLGPLSLLMKGEIVPPASRWHGVPTVKSLTLPI
ncbi:MAG TPA: Pls/PosA family non-ribosomal peptide synthetase [Xanthobacteraceae bacterium]|jgi:non-ribosomal peptide synthetase-like protein